MFYGSIPSDVQTIMADIVKDWECKDLYVGCSGNFTCEKLISPMNKFEIHSNDVILYSYCLGRYLSGQPLEIELSDDGLKIIPWAEQYLQKPIDCLATVLVLSGAMRFMDKDNAYYRKMYNAYVNQFAKLHSQTVEKISKNEMHILSYFNGDAMEFVKKSPTESGFVSYPPFTNAGKAFIKDFAKLESLFRFKQPTYTVFDENTLLDYFKLITEKKYWLFGTNAKLSEPFDKYLKAVSKTTNRGIAIYLYSNTGKTRFIGPRQVTEELKIPRLMPGDTVGNHIELKLISKNAFQTFRSEYMNANIRPGIASQAVGVLVDGKLCGVYAFSASSTFANWNPYGDAPTMYLLSDFPVEPVDYDRLAKLVLYAALSKESKLIAESIVKKRIYNLVTTAFSQNPVSMKYRGLFKIFNRKENKALQEKWAVDIDPTNAYYNQKYEINYGAKMGEWTLEEGLQMWKAKHSQRTGKKELA